LGGIELVRRIPMEREGIKKEGTTEQEKQKKKERKVTRDMKGLSKKEGERTCPA
jgi:hypothetical protein